MPWNRKEKRFQNFKKGYFFMFATAFFRRTFGHASSCPVCTVFSMLLTIIGWYEGIVTGIHPNSNEFDESIANPPWEYWVMSESRHIKYRVPYLILDRMTGPSLRHHPFSRFPSFGTQNSTECDYVITPLKWEPSRGLQRHHTQVLRKHIPLNGYVWSQVECLEIG
jgi:hypothetical protein